MHIEGGTPDYSNNTVNEIYTRTNLFSQKML